MEALALRDEIKHLQVMTLDAGSNVLYSGSTSAENLQCLAGAVLNETSILAGSNHDWGAACAC